MIGTMLDSTLRRFITEALYQPSSQILHFQETTQMMSHCILLKLPRSNSELNLKAIFRPGVGQIFVVFSFVIVAHYSGEVILQPPILHWIKYNTE